MIETLRIADRLRRQALTRDQPWLVVGDTIFDTHGNTICVTPDAPYIADLHNHIMLICNDFFMLAKKRADAVAMRKEQNAS